MGAEGCRLWWVGNLISEPKLKYMKERNLEAGNVHVFMWTYGLIYVVPECYGSRLSINCPSGVANATHGPGPMSASSLNNSANTLSPLNTWIVQ